MGLVSGLFTAPLAPVWGVVWLGEQIQEQAESEYFDPVVIRGQLDDIEEAYCAGELTEQERNDLQNDLLARMMDAQRAGPPRE